MNPNMSSFILYQGDALKAASAALGSRSRWEGGPETAFGRITAALLSERALEVADARDKILVKYTVSGRVWTWLWM